MGKHYFFVIIFSLTILFNLNAYAQKNAPVGGGGDFRGKGSSGSWPASPAPTRAVATPAPAVAKTPVVECKHQLSKLDYVGIKFKGTAICVEASDDKTARLACGGTKKTRIVNPGNPQYGLVKEGTEGNTRTTNSLGYYYCVEDSNNKKDMCLNEAKEKNDKYDFYWRDDSGNLLEDSTADGNCFCSLKLSVSDYGPQQELQKCESEEQIQAAGKKETTPLAKVAKSSTEPDPEFKKCVDEYIARSNRCKEAAEETGKNCGTGAEMSKDEKEKAAAIDATNEMLTAPKVGKGMQAECFTAGLVASGAKLTLTGSKESCAADVKACASLCSEEESKRLRDKCVAIIGDAEDKNEFATQQLKEFDEVVTENNVIYEDAKKVCTEDAKKSQFSADSLLRKVGDALSSSVRCMCQTSGGGNCNDIPTVAACDVNPGSPGCGVYASVAVCTPGSGYDAKLCSCQLNPKEAGCPGGGLSGGLSNFASPSIKSNGINDGATPTIAGGLKATGAFPDLARGTDDSSSGGTPMTLGASPASGPGGGVGGGGGGGASGGGEPPAAAGEPEAEEKGFGGLFNQAKTFFKDALGGKKTPTAATKNGKSEKGFDPNKLRPTRGLASKNGIGSKNQDIWKMSNSCMYAETCPRNMNSFLEAPLKQK